MKRYLFRLVVLVGLVCVSANLFGQGDDFWEKVLSLELEDPMGDRNNYDRFYYSGPMSINSRGESFVMSDRHQLWHIKPNALTIYKVAKYYGDLPGQSRISHLQIDSNDHLYAATHNEIYRSVDEGETWDLVENTDDLGADNKITLFVIDRNNTFYMSIGDTTDNGFFISTDNAASWSSVKTGIRHINSLAIAPDGLILLTGKGFRQEHVFSGRYPFNPSHHWDQPEMPDSDLIFTSPDSSIWGFNGYIVLPFPNINYTFGNRYPYDNKPFDIDVGYHYKVAFNKTGKIVIVYGGGIPMISVDEGNTWRELGTHRYITHVWVGNDGYINGISAEGTLLKSHYPVTPKSSAKLPKQPVSISLTINYPNPFNSSTKIKYHLRQDSDVEIKVYNAIGVEIKTIMSQYQLNGEHEIQWDGTDKHGVQVSSGVYYYKITTKMGIEVRKLLLLK